MLGALLLRETTEDYCSERTDTLLLVLCLDQALVVQ